MSLFAGWAGGKIACDLKAYRPSLYLTVRHKTATGPHSARTRRRGAFFETPARAKVLHGGGKGNVRIAVLSGLSRGLRHQDGFPEFYAAPEKPYTP